MIFKSDLRLIISMSLSSRACSGWAVSQKISYWLEDINIYEWQTGIITGSENLPGDRVTDTENTRSGRSAEDVLFKMCLKKDRQSSGSVRIQTCWGLSDTQFTFLILLLVLCPFVWLKEALLGRWCSLCSPVSNLLFHSPLLWVPHLNL